MLPEITPSIHSFGASIISSIKIEHTIVISKFLSFSKIKRSINIANINI